jgi:hypothetical protein
MDALAVVFFPSRKYLNSTLAVYTVAMAGGLSWYFQSWWWAVAVLASMLLAWIITEWF